MNSSSSCCCSTIAHLVPSLGRLLKYMLSVDRVTMSQHLEKRSKDNRRITEQDIEQPEPIVKQDLLWRSK
jgi:hypothetical protein